MLGSVVAAFALCLAHGVPRARADYNEVPKFSERWEPLLREWGAPINGTRHSELAEQAVGAFQHSYRSYVTHGYPSDNVKPQTCEGVDVQGGAAITLLDSLDALLVFGQVDDFRKAVPLVEAIHFNRSVTIDVFEVTIRSLGGLLSAHMATLRNPALLPDYDGMFLRKARDLGDRLMPAFDTPTGMPANFLSLTNGHDPKSPKNTWTAALGTLAIEFRLLSHFTGAPQYGERADRAMGEVFSRRDSNTGLVGSAINRDSGKWAAPTTSIGPGVDSYYEYLLKVYLIFGDEWYLEMFVDQYVRVQRYMAVPESWNGFNWILDVHMSSGRVARSTVSSLAAFWPGMQVSIGLEADARKHMEDFVRAHLRHGWMPDSFNTDLGPSTGVAWPLRPELMESAYMLWWYTGDPRYKRLVEGTFEQLQEQTRCTCGYCGVKNVATGELEDIMESFFLAETIKYMYLLLSNGTAVNDHYVFTTEGHLVSVLPSPPQHYGAEDGEDEYYDAPEEGDEEAKMREVKEVRQGVGQAAEGGEAEEGRALAPGPAAAAEEVAPEESRRGKERSGAAAAGVAPVPLEGSEGRVQGGRLLAAAADRGKVEFHLEGGLVEPGAAVGPVAAAAPAVAEGGEGQGARADAAPAVADAAPAAADSAPAGADAAPAGEEGSEGAGADATQADATHADAAEADANGEADVCQHICREVDMATLEAKAAAGSQQYPALSFAAADAALLHKRRCTACRAVQRGFAAMPAEPKCTAATRLFIQYHDCPELPKPEKPKVAQEKPGKPTPPAKQSRPAGSDNGMETLQRIMDVSQDLMINLIEDAAESEAAAPMGAPELDIRCRKPPRGAPETAACSKPGAPGYKLAVYGLCYLRAARGRLACGRMAVVPAAGVPRALLSALLPAVLPARVVVAEVHLHMSVLEALQADAFDDGTGAQVDLVWDVVQHDALSGALAQLEEEAKAGGSGVELLEAAVALQLVPFVEDWLLDNRDFMSATLELTP
eukprot:jgi/Ulvmu1/1061/UM105_0020.1